MGTILHEYLGGFMMRHLPGVLVGMGLFGFGLIYLYPASRKYLNWLAVALSGYLVWLGFSTKDEASNNKEE